MTAPTPPVPEPAPVLPDGMAPWDGRTAEPPEDWDGGPYMCRDGKMYHMCGYDWKHGTGCYNSTADWDRIAYTPKAPAPVDALVTQEYDEARDLLLEARGAWRDILAGMQRFGMESAAIDKIDQFFSRLTDDMIRQFWGDALAPDSTAERRGYQAATERAAGIAEAEAATSETMMNGAGRGALVERERNRACLKIAKDIRGTDHAE